MSSRAELTDGMLDRIQRFIGSAVLTNERIARSLGINVVDLQAFGMIMRAGTPLTAGEVSQLTELPTSTTTRVLDRLEKHGFVVRETDPADRRRVVVRVSDGPASPFGRGGADDPYADIVEGMRHVHEQFSVDELAVVTRYFDAMQAGQPGAAGGGSSSAAAGGRSGARSTADA
jgi:hypothetical protein